MLFSLEQLYFKDVCLGQLDAWVKNGIAIPKWRHGKTYYLIEIWK